ncbi:hypothetical protein OG871_27930 [Kitasatospora sp. NBC_00374]|uniref:hypothetical protein n=1 Tax=Kitasatospora sp. NBC_00374 TaxID=2975964 RepID=UPI0030DFBF7F
MLDQALAVVESRRTPADEAPIREARAEAAAARGGLPTARQQLLCACEIHEGHRWAAWGGATGPAGRARRSRLSFRSPPSLRWRSTGSALSAMVSRAVWVPR